MTPERWREISDVFQLALERSSEQRPGYVLHMCAGDSQLQAEVELLLNAHERAEDFLEPVAVSRELAGRAVGPYMIGERIGAGGMGEVYLATDTRLGRRVALKFLPAHFSADHDRVLRFQQEARATSALNHPNILTIHDLGELDSRHYIASEYVEGETLRARMVQRRLSTHEAITTVLQIASALSAAHAAGVVHRDIKPENVMLRNDGLVKVVDFGLAKLMGAADTLSITEVRTGDGMVLGTPDYMAPEQIRGKLQDARTDLWSVGVLLYEIVAGRRPFDSTASILSDEVPRAHALPALEGIAGKLLQKNPEDRYQSAEELIAALEPIRTARPPWRRVLGAAAATAAVATATLVTLGSRHNSRPPPAIVTAPVQSVAVLPFVNLSPGHSDDYLADGVTVELIDALSLLPGVKVVSRTSSFALKGSRDDVRVLSRRLNVRTVVEGSVRKAGNRLRVSAELINAADGYRLWSQTFDDEITDLYTIQRRIATSVAGTLQPRLGSQTLSAIGTNDPEAYDAYLKGRQAALEITSERIGSAISYFRSAVERDPSFSNAWAGLAEAYALLDHARGPATMSSAQSYQLAEEAGRRALSLNPDSAEALAALGHIYIHTGNAVAADRYLRRAIGLNPNSGSIRIWYALYLETAGRPADELRAQFLRARESDPLSLHVCRFAEMNLEFAGDFDGAIDFARHHLEIAPDDWSAYVRIANSYAFQKRFTEAEQQLQRAERASPPPPPAQIAITRALLLGLSGERSEALNIIDQVARDRERGRNFLSEEDFIQLYAVAGDNDKAVKWLEAMVRRSRNYARVNARLPLHPVFDALGTDPRYLKICRDLGATPTATSQQHTAS